MMQEGIFSLAVFAVVATITPGGATTLATDSGARFGYRRSVPLMAGIAAGLASMAALAAVGLSTAILAVPSLQLMLKLLGTAYLLWLAFKIARNGAPQSSSAPTSPAGFVTGVWLLWQNPKGWTMTLGAAASFATLVDGPARLATLLGVAFAVASSVSLSIWCVAGLLLARRLRSERQWQVFNLILALTLIMSIVPMWLE
jgi:threonine/homoserine/homoserine lactone efflux protein